MAVQKPLVVDNGTTQNLPAGDQLDLGAFTLPATDGTANQVLQTDGAGTVSWASVGGTGTVTSVDVSGGTTGLTTSGGPITGSGTITLAGTLDADNGGTGISSYAVGDLLYANTTSTLAKLADVATGNALISGGVGVAPSWGKVGLTTHVSGTLPLANGGTGTNTTPGLGQVLIGNGVLAVWSNLTAGTNIAITNGMSSITVGLSGTVGVGNGGTGFTTATLGDLVYASAANTLGKLADVATGNALISGGVGAAPSYGKIGLTTHISGVLAPANGGTGSALIPSNGQLPIGNGTSANWANLTQGTGIAITNGSGSITIAASNAAGVQPIASTSANITLTTANYTVICNSTTQNITATLPLATGNTGRVFIIKRNGATNAVTVSSTSNIDGSPTYSLAADKAAVTVQSDGTTWWVIAKA